MKKVAIVGSGIAGIGTAIRLANKGYKVSVFEANTYLGGKLTVISNKGYRFDAGPSLFTQPEKVVELFKLSNRNPDDYFQFKRLDPITRYFYEDGTQLTAWAEPQKFAEEMEAQIQEPKQRVLSYLDKSQEIFEITNEVFLNSSLHKFDTFFSTGTLKSAVQLHKINLFSTMDEANAKHFKTEKARQLFNRYATYNGSNPYEAPATLNVIPHLEFNLGAYFPEGGMHEIPQSLIRLAKELGVKFYTNHPVEKIIVERNEVKGIKVNEQTLNFDRVVSNMDVTKTYRKLLPDLKEPYKVTNQEKSSSAIIFYWGIRQEFPALDVHNIFFSKDYQKEFSEMFDHKNIDNDPTVYIHISSKVKKNDAPEGCENWFVMVNAPHDAGQDWEEIIKRSRRNVLEKLSRILKTNIEELIETEDLLTPQLIEQRTSSMHGALYGNSSNNKYAAFLRHANFHQNVDGLYFCGGSVHPGGGIPLCLSSAKIVADLFK